MRISILALACAGTLFATAAYADDPMENTYTNTVVSKDHASGGVTDLYFNKDMSYTAKAMGQDGKPIQLAGSWSLKDDGKTICLAPNAPANTPAGQPSCSPLEKHNVGDSWSLTNDKGQSFDITITAGR